MIVSIVLTRDDWHNIETIWTTATRRFEMEKDWEFFQITDEGPIRKFTLKAFAHGEHESTEIMVEIKLFPFDVEQQMTWSASKRCISLPSCEVKYIEEGNSRSSSITRFTPDDPIQGTVKA
jgi:hypothetical protein